MERRLQTRLQVATGNFLSDTVSDSWNAQRARTAIHLRNFHASHRRRKELPDDSRCQSPSRLFSGRPQSPPMDCPSFSSRSSFSLHLVKLPVPVGMSKALPCTQLLLLQLAEFAIASG